MIWPSTPGLVADVQRWVDNPADNHGWLMRGDEAGTQTATRLVSRDSTDTLSRPRLRVNWLPPAVEADIPLPPWALGLLGVGLVGALLRRR